jgi:hypothetical protein
LAALRTFAAGTGASVPMLDLLDEAGGLARRVISEAFAEYRRMEQAHAPRAKLASDCASLEDRHTLSRSSPR